MQADDERSAPRIPALLSRRFSRLESPFVQFDHS